MNIPTVHHKFAPRLEQHILDGVEHLALFDLPRNLRRLVLADAVCLQISAQLFLGILQIHFHSFLPCLCI